MVAGSTSRQAPIAAESSIFDDDDDGWQDMPVIRSVDPGLALDEEDQKRYHYVPPEKLSADTHGPGSNATGNLIDFDDRGNEWREKVESNEDDYTRLKLDDDDFADDAYLRTRYLFDEDKAMTPLSQMQATKNLLTEAQRIAYVGLCSLVARQMTHTMSQARRKELASAVKSMELWRLKIMGRIYYHMELETDEQKMIESLAEHGVDPMDLVPSLMTTHTVANPEYDPAEARQKRIDDENRAHSSGPPPYALAEHEQEVEHEGQDVLAPPNASDSMTSPRIPPHTPSLLHPGESIQNQTTTNVLQPKEATTIPGVSTTLSSTDENVTLDIRWTVLCDLFLILIADSVYDARSRMLLENVATRLGLGWLDVVRFEKRVTDALEIQEGVERLEQREVIEDRRNAAKKRRYVMMGLATLGGGLVIGLSAGLLAPVIGAGLGAAFTTIGVTGTAGFLGGVGGAAVITTGGVLTGSGIAAKGMSRRTQQVRTFDLLPIHNNKRVTCIIAVPGFMSSARDDVRLPFSVLDSLVGDVFTVRWEPEMMGEMGDAFKILTSEVLSQVGTTVLQATVMTALMSALQWPIILTKLGYLIDNPWSNALDRARAAGLVLADVLLNRALGVRPITLIGYSLGARAIFYALVELAKQKAFGIVQDVFLLGTTVSASTKTWLEARSVVSGRFVNGFARNDWLLNYLFRATSGGGTVAGLRPIENVPGLENVDVTDKIAGHLSYRTYMPVILDQLGFPVTATYFDEPEEPDMTQDRMVVREEEAVQTKKSRFSIFKSKSKIQQPSTSQNGRIPPPPSTRSKTSTQTPLPPITDDDLPKRIEASTPAPSTPIPSPPSTLSSTTSTPEPESSIPAKAGFDFKAIGKVLGKEDLDPSKIPLSIVSPVPQSSSSPNAVASYERAESAPPPLPLDGSDIPTPRAKSTALPDPGMEANHSESADSSLSFRASFHRSLSLGDTSTEDEEEFVSQSRPAPREQSSFSLRPLQAPSWPPSSTLSYPSFPAADGPVWASGTSTSSDPLRLPPSLDSHNFAPFSTPSMSFGASHTSISIPSEPQLSFGTGDGLISSSDASSSASLSSAERDAWIPKPIGLSAAIERKQSSYTLNPWET